MIQAVSFLAKGELVMASSTQAPEVREREAERVEVPALPTWPLSSPRREEKPPRFVTKLAGSIPG
jgi:hypothetical protein